MPVEGADVVMKKRHATVLETPYVATLSAIRFWNLAGVLCNTGVLHFNAFTMTVC